MVWVYILALLTAAAWAYQLLAWVSARRFFGGPPPRKALPPGPGVTVLKPLRGRGAASRECLESFFIQDYRPYELIFGVADTEDPVLGLIEELRQAHPQVPVQVVVCRAHLGHNPKISKLRQMAPLARYELLAISDGDIEVRPDYVACLAAALQDPAAGLVTCPYRAGPARTLGAGLEALTISADFMPSVAVAYYVEGVSFALGATMALPQGVLRRLGGLAVLADYLADDYQLGWRVARLGLKVRLLPYVVETHTPDMSLMDYLRHQLRWARTYRVCRPSGFLGYGITHALAYAAGLWLASGLAAWAGLILLATLGSRLYLAWSADHDCLKGRLPWYFLALTPLKDALAFILWAMSFLGNRVTWAGADFQVTKEGILTPLGPNSPKD
jgi:ceramide glucosyltransferase